MNLLHGAPQAEPTPTEGAPAGSSDREDALRCGDPKSTTWSPDELDRAAALFRALGHEGRLLVLLRLSQSEGLTVTELLEELRIEQSTLSHQLRLLKAARLVRSHRRGRHIVYSLFDRHISHVVADTLEHVREESPP